MYFFRNLQFDIHPAEAIILKITVALLAVNFIQIVMRGVEIDWFGYGMLTALAVFFFAFGQYYRLSGRSKRIGLALLCTGIFSIFSWATVMFNYLLMPTINPPIDEALIWADSLFGFHWPSAIAWAAENPVINLISRIAYATTIPQIALLIIILGFTGRAQQLHTMMLSIVFTSLLAVGFWGIFPTHGAKSLFTLAPEIQAAANPIVTTDYGRELLELAKNGPGYIAPSEVLGLIAFPSYHVVLAFSAMYFMRGVKVMGTLYILLNLIIIPATPLHGGHHMVDIFGGFVTFLIGTYFAEKMVRAMYTRSGTAARLAPDRRAKPAAA